MIDIKNPNAPMKVNPTFRDDLAVDMDNWCEANCNGQWEITDIDNARFEFPDDAAQFTHYFWTPTVSFGV